ncbi:MAG: hypothetical protein IJV33_02680 [Bacteroidaceae bacterium]|nr:hypothetical protein [Bacteroidaceae bacterium]
MDGGRGEEEKGGKDTCGKTAGRRDGKEREEREEEEGAAMTSLHREPEGEKRRKKRIKEEEREPAGKPLDAGEKERDGA